ncbi:MAG TPA: PorP/SprF family type IX secretion system membrane protein [Chryseosolibacter sp.]|nr:PorP/SprF family type IX secretion system membrane protein [Chryseosolibacter sp.]
MKRFLVGGLMLLLGDIIVHAQDMPLFSQKLTNSFIYNPAIAGHTFGSMTYSFKQSYRVDGAPENHFLSVHTPIANHRFGVGASVYQEDVTFLRLMYATGAFAYHIPLNKLSTLSFGVSAEFNSFKTNGANLSYVEDSEYLAYVTGLKEYDFSFGAHYQNRYIKAGIASNRLSTAWVRDTSKVVLSNYYSSFVQGLIPLRNNEDLLEPYIAYRKFSDLNNILDVGIFYTYSNKITAGVSMRNLNVINATLGFRLSKYLLVGYSRDMITGNVGGVIGAGNEFSLRFDFNENNYKERFRSDYKSSVAYRRKTMSKGPVGRSASRSPKDIKKKQRKIAPYSPNSRYQNTKKLSIKKRKSSSKPSASKKRKKNNSYKRHYKKRR